VTDNTTLLDEIATQRQAVGSLAWIRDAQAPARFDAEISIDAYAALTDQAATSGSALSPLVARELVQLEYLDESGAWSEAGVYARTLAFANPDRATRVTSRSGNTERVFFAGFDDEFALVVASGAEVATGMLGLTLLPLQGLPNFLAKWMPLSPEWAFSNTESPLTNEQIAGLVLGEITGLPEAAGPQQGAMAAERWTRYVLRFGDTEPRVLIAVENWGYFLANPVADSDTVILSAFPSSMVYELLIFGVLSQH